jgi:hypothetical protein
MEKKSRTKTTKYRSASDFIRHQPLEMPAKEVVEAAARVGMELNAGLVRVTRFKMRHAGGRPGTAGRFLRPRLRKTSGASLGLEAQFRKLVAQLGTRRAHAVVAEVAKAFECLGL